MRHITTLLILIFSTSIFAQNNVVKTAGVSYTAGAPTFSPGRTGSQVAIDTVTGLWYEHNGTSWSASGYRVQTISGCSAPNYTPTKYQSRLVINACTAGQGGPELYYYTGGSWLQINEGQTYTAGSGISIAGNQISASDISPTNELQTLSISGSDLTLSDGGGTVTIPAGADGNGIYSGDGTVTSGTEATMNGMSLAFQASYGDYNDFVGFTQDATNYSGAAINSGGDGEYAFVSYHASADNSQFTQYRITYGGTQIAVGAGSETSNYNYQSNGLYMTIPAGTGMQYTNEYPEILTNDRSIPDVGSVNKLKQTLVSYTTTQRNAISSPAAGYIIYCSDCTATDSSTGVQQVYNGSTWKNAW